MMHGVDTYLETLVDWPLRAFEESEGVLAPVHNYCFRPVIAERDQLSTQGDGPECRCNTADGLKARSAFLSWDSEDFDALRSTIKISAQLREVV